MMNKFELINVAYKSRFLYRTDAEFRKALGATFETIVSKRESERDMDMYFGILERRAAEFSDIPLSEILNDFGLASKAYLSTDWGERTQLASRKKFCRRLFRLSVTAGMELTNEEAEKFREKDGDKELLDYFLPDSREDTMVMIVCFLLLFTFGILRPWNDENFRSHDARDKETVEAVKKLIALIDVLKEDTPRLGSLEKPLVFNDWTKILEDDLADPDQLPDCTPMLMVTSLTDISQSCRALVILEDQRVMSEKFHGHYMNRIWVDDADNGKSRFWIFPDNTLSALCYRRDGMSWVLDPYDFRVRETFNPSVRDMFTMVSPKGNVNYVLHPDKSLPDDFMSTGHYDYDMDEESGVIVRLRLFEDPHPFPEWLDWHEWVRLEYDDPRYSEFREVLADIYTPGNTLSTLFRNSAPEITDDVNTLVGRDNKYLYVYDWCPDRFVVREEERGKFTYLGDCKEYETMKGLFELEISEEHPLYLFPIEMKRWNKRNRTLEKLEEVMKDAENITEVCICHSERLRFPRLILPAYGLFLDLDMEILAQVGVIKLTARPF